MHSPLTSHLKIAFKILRYLKSRLGLGVRITMTSGMFLTAYSDVDWAKCIVTRKSVTGYCVFLNNSIVSWKSNKQNTFSKSSTEAEYRALASVTSEVTIKIAANPVFLERTKHLEIDLHFVREKVLKEVVKTVKVDSANQIADILTKGLDTVQHLELVKTLDLVDKSLLGYLTVETASGFLVTLSGFACDGVRTLATASKHSRPKETLEDSVSQDKEDNSTCARRDENHIHTLGDYSRPSHEGYRNTIELPDGNNVVPLQSDTIRLVHNGCSFHGLQSEDPNQHLKDFLKLVDTLDLDVANRERTHLRLFQFSLRDQASNWLEYLPAGSISAWEDLTIRFLAQFFPSGRTAKLRNDILMFQQHQGESLSKALTRFKDLL
ncbi:zinc finger, CCHC-type containing protein [Tanacetum coccineum]